MGLSRAGFTVDAVCPWRHSLSTLHCIHKTYAHYGVSPADSFLRAILLAKPDLIVPCDDLAAQHLHHLYAKENRRNSPVRALIERSLGSSESFPILYQRAAFIEMARREGIRAPETQVIRTADDLDRWTATVGFPTVLKADRTSGGEGVRIVRNMDEAKYAFKILSGPPLVARALKRAVIDQDSSLLGSSLLRRGTVVSAQAFISGREATSAVACWRGTILASLNFEVINKTSATGHSTVLRLIENAEISAATEKVVRQLSLSGINGLDFVLEAQTGNPYLIEINPRATQVGHLAFGSGRDIPAALFACVTGRPIREGPVVTEQQVIALFPQEWRRDPASRFLSSGYHDVPWEEPGLIRACVRRRRKEWANYAEQEALRNLAPARVPRS